MLKDPDGVLRSSAIYLPDLDRYVMVTVHTDQDAGGHLALWEAPEPWGPWTNFERYEDWYADTGSPVDGPFRYGNFSPKWGSGQDCVFVFFRPDAWNSVACRFVLDGEESSPPAGAHGGVPRP